MWDYSLIYLALLVLIVIVTVRIRTSHRYNASKKYRKMIGSYRNRISNNLSNELVYQYISDISGLPKFEQKNMYTDKLVEFYEVIADDGNISEDLKFQLKVALSLKGIRV